jgi:hypothetical protein
VVDLEESWDDYPEEDDPDELTVYEMEKNPSTFATYITMTKQVSTVRVYSPFSPFRARVRVPSVLSVEGFYEFIGLKIDSQFRFQTHTLIFYMGTIRIRFPLKWRQLVTVSLAAESQGLWSFLIRISMRCGSWTSCGSRLRYEAIFLDLLIPRYFHIRELISSVAASFQLPPDALRAISLRDGMSMGSIILRWWYRVSGSRTLSFSN